MNNLLWLPIDIPKFPINNFNLQSEFHWNFWNVTKLTEPRSSSYEKTQIVNSVHEKFPELISWLHNFPYLSIRNIKFNIQTVPVSPHIDFTNPGLEPELYLNNKTNEPCGYRILLRGNRSNRLYVIKNGIRHYVTLPETTDTYVLGHTNVLHGVDDDSSRITIFTHFEIDSVRHNLLLAKSLAKYSDYAVYD